MIRKIAIATFIPAILGACTALYVFNMPHKKVEHVKGIAITASELAKDFNKNEKDANAKYLDKAIEVSGIISEVDKNQDGGTMIVLQTGDSDKAIQCAMREKVINKEKGQSISLKGFCSDYGITGVTLTDCIIQ